MPDWSNLAVTTHIIGKPPAPKGGGNVRIEERGHGSGYCVSLSGPMSRGEAERFARALEEAAAPDPAVTTYGELEPGGFCQFTDSTRTDLWQKGHRGQYLTGTTGDFSAVRDHDPVRPVAVSVVVHEEPGTHVWPDDADSSRVAILEPESGRMSYERAEAKTIVRQLAAWLAQEPASPESDEPDPEDVDPLIADGLHGRPLGDSELRRCFTEPESAEDRSKPAPGWSVAVNTRHERDLWEARRGDGYGGYFDFETDAIAWTWAQRDAQQAGKGGES